MNYNVNTYITNIDNNIIKEKINNLINMYLKESEKNIKVAFYYENPNTKDIISYNKEMCFYAASSIKILVCLLILEKAEKNLIDLEKDVLITRNDIKKGTGIIKNQTKDTKYSIKELIKLTITESDNTAYIKLVNMIKKDNLKKYGLNLGAKHTMEGKEKDSFGIINCEDMIIYWKKVKEYIDSNHKYSKTLKKFLQNTSTKLIDSATINNKTFIRKYGSFDINYHEAGYIEDKKDFYYLIILTSLNKQNNKKKFINKTAKIIDDINKILISKNQ